MRELVEWAFRFTVTTPEPVPHREIEALLDDAVHWAEAHSFGVGGGFSSEGDDATSSSWDFEFGLCATLDHQLIPESRAKALLCHIRSKCSARGFSLQGGFREFTEEELCDS